MSYSHTFDSVIFRRKREGWPRFMFAFVRITLKWKERVEIGTPNPVPGHLY